MAEKEFIVLVILVSLLVVGCQETVESKEAEQIPTENGVTRVFSKASVNPGESIQLKLYVNLNEGQSYYLLEEAVPKEVEIIDCGHDENNKIKMIEIQNAQSKVYECTLKAPLEPGEYKFEGEFALEGMSKPTGIYGANTITVQ